MPWETVPELSRQQVVRLLAELAARMVIAAGRDGGEFRDGDGSVGTA
ncbi:hypothetical protein [Streptomyces sp. R41]|jgi:hypothetical protein|uniref:Uncharacterized protein n=1 Tax=Streptomyces sp. R41 TaxID=3238632 RepID=A0AB39RB98_9ACTN